jgi:hypothetical protein
MGQIKSYEKKFIDINYQSPLDIIDMKIKKDLEIEKVE